MAEVIETYTQEVPALRFIGLKYSDEDRQGGGFGHCWGEWFEKNRFATLEALVDGNTSKTCEDGAAYIGYMRCNDGEPFEYHIGMFMPEGTEVPEGFVHIDVPKSTLGVGWLYGPESDLYAQEHKCSEKLEEQGYKIKTDEKGATWFMERYVCPRFTTPDEKGNVILDICFYI